MKLTKRLKTICDLVDKGTTVIDVGCDHAHVDIFLTLNNLNNCIALDVNKNALNSAINNIKKYQLEDKIKTVINDGLKDLEIPKNNTIIICGMGTHTILNILKNCDYKKIDNLIIQSNNDLYLLRKSINKLGFYIEEDIKLKDKNIYYTIIKFKKGHKKYNKYEYLYGINLNNKDYIKYEIDRNNNILSKIPNKMILKKISLKRNNKYLKRFI